VPARKYLTWAAAALVVFVVIRRPAEATQSLNEAAGALARAGDAFATFVTELG
jgi:hypothetical protein